MERTGTRISSLGAIGRAGAVLAVAAVVAACGGGGATTAPATTRPATAAPATGAPATGAPATGAPATVAAGGLTLGVTTATVGTYVVGDGGKSLYTFVPDTGTTSACTGECAANWPPLVTQDIATVTAGTGVTGALGTITRDDGSLQVTLGGAPLYYFASDATAGDTKGQGLNDVWYLAAPDGKGIGAPATGAGPDY